MGRIIKVRFGTDEIRDESDGVKAMTCVRVYADTMHCEWCGHEHRSHASAVKCARRMGLGWLAGQSGASWVTIIGVGACPAPWRNGRHEVYSMRDGLTAPVVQVCAACEKMGDAL